MQLTLFSENTLELFCPSCENERIFAHNPKFETWDCTECRFPVFVEIRNESNTWELPEECQYWQPPKPSRCGGIDHGVTSPNK